MFAHPKKIAICMRIFEVWLHAGDTPLYCPYTTSLLRLLSVFCVAMWLTALLLGARWTPGKQWIGKHRRVLKMTSTRRRNQAERDAQIKQVGSRECRATRDVCTSVPAFLRTIATCA